MATRKRRTSLEQYFFRGTPVLDECTDLCTVSTMTIPKRIVENEVMKQLWDFICTDMESRRCLSSTYTLLISELCEVICLMNTCREKLDKEGLVIDKYTEEGQFMSSQPSPYYNILQRQQPMLVKLLEKIGMSPRDIHYLVNPEATSLQPIEVQATEMQKITYFR
tara:strand:- start:67 stop:561 length:495 start_codon:yes stop_codon:yes gene_type:complete